MATGAGNQITHPPLSLFFSSSGSGSEITGQGIRSMDFYGGEDGGIVGKTREKCKRVVGATKSKQ